MHFFNKGASFSGIERIEKKLKQEKLMNYLWFQVAAIDLLSDTDNDTLIHNMSEGSFSMDDKASLESASGSGSSGINRSNGDRSGTGGNGREGGNNSIGKDSQGKESRVSSGNSR